MKKITLSVIGLLTYLLFSTCEKNRPISGGEQSLITQAKAYFENSVTSTGKINLTNYRANQQRSPVWDSAAITHLPSGDIVVVPVTYRKNLLVSSAANRGMVYRLSDLTSLVLSKDSLGHFRTAAITFIPDSSRSPGSGQYIMEDWQGNTLYRPIHAAPKPGTKEVDYIQSIQVCNEIDGYNYSPDDPDDGFAWSETTCTTYSVPSGSPTISSLPTGLLPPPRSIPSLQIVVPPPSSPITDIAAYFKCFTNSTGIDHTYSVTVCVNQPISGSRQAWTFTDGGPIGSIGAGNPVNVGHTFLILNENSAGTIITRNVGFYPLTSVNPAYPSEQGQLDDNELTGYNISLTYDISNQQFFNILNYLSIGNNSGYLYDLSSNNCTTFALHGLAAGDINLSSQQGTWPGGSGDDPGDLGEDIRSMALPPNATRNTVSNPHPNQGSCN